MRIHRSAIATSLAVMALVVEGCGNAASPPTSHSPVAVSDLPGIILGSDEPAPGTKFSRASVGAEYLTARSQFEMGHSPFAPPTDEDGFIGGAEIEFIPLTSDRAPTDEQIDGSIVSGVMAYRDADTAARAFAAHAERYRGRQTADGGIAPVNALATGALGSESFGIGGSFYAGAPSFDLNLYVWRASNLVLYVYGWGAQGTIGSLDPAVLLDIAAKMQTRVGS